MYLYILLKKKNERTYETITCLVCSFIQNVLQDISLHIKYFLRDILLK